MSIRHDALTNRDAVKHSILTLLRLSVGFDDADPPDNEEKELVEKIITLRNSLNINALNIQFKSQREGVPVVAQWLTNPTRNHEVVSSIPNHTR